MDDPRRFTPPAVGGSSLLVIFAVLCLTIFALLGLGTVQADQRLSDASAEAVYGYYAADCQAEAILPGCGLGNCRRASRPCPAIPIHIPVPSPTPRCWRWRCG